MSPYTPPITPLYFHAIFSASAWNARCGFPVEGKTPCRIRTAGPSDTTVKPSRINSPTGEWATAANDALICPESGDDEGGRGLHFIDWQGKGQSGGMAPLGLHRWSDISCEEIKTRPVNGANGEERPGCTIDRRRRRRREKWRRNEGTCSLTGGPCEDQVWHPASHFADFPPGFPPARWTAAQLKHI